MIENGKAYIDEQTSEQIAEQKGTPTNLEMESLVNELFACSNVNYTPDGKAILCILPQSEIEQLMG